jgi:hypothetical protein
MFPEFEIYLFFVLPVKVKWLALVTWLCYGGQFLLGDWQVRLLVAASVCNFLLFFGRNIVAAVRAGRRRMAADAAQATRRRDALHTCAVCGLTEHDEHAMEFRYCAKCRPARCFCTRHMAGHAHVTGKA